MAFKTKTGPHASQTVRDIVQGLVDMHRAAIANGGSVVLNPEDPHEERVTYDVESNHLLRWLEDFAREGTFQNTTDFNRLIANGIAKRAGPRYADKVQAVADEMRVSDRTAARLLSRSGTKKR